MFQIPGTGKAEPSGRKQTLDPENRSGHDQVLLEQRVRRSCIGSGKRQCLGFNRCSNKQVSVKQLAYSFYERIGILVLDRKIDLAHQDIILVLAATIIFRHIIITATVAFENVIDLLQLAAAVMEIYRNANNRDHIKANGKRK